jgi:hypothetical protein
VVCAAGAYVSVGQWNLELQLEREKGRGDGGSNGLEIISARDAWRWEVPGDVGDGLQCVDHVVDGPSDGCQIVRVSIRKGLNDHVQ